jgi:hypothetical protein
MFFNIFLYFCTRYLIYDMRKWVLAAVISSFLTSLYAQPAYDETHENVLLSASNYMAYPGPTQQKLTPAPRGYKPFYISHYGRHGSRFHSKPSIYNAPYQTLSKADSLGKLTAIGKDVLHRLDIIRHDAENHWGDLTPLGAQQEQDIARRMYERFPEVFKDSAYVDARSTGVGRCVLSMEYALMQLIRLNPELKIRHDATRRDANYLNLQDKDVFNLRKLKKATQPYDDFKRRYGECNHLMQTLFNDSSYVRQHINNYDLAEQLMLIAAIMQNVELGKTTSLFDIFTKDEIYRIWKIGNAWWYIGWGASEATDGKIPYLQSNLLRKIIQQADSCIQRPETHVHLRFGHETVLLPLVCLLDINGYGLVTDDLDQLDAKGWINYHVFPMGSNLQFIFYRKSPSDREPIFKVLLNENEATLPLPSDLAPYYRWSDFHKYYLSKLDAYEN